MNGKKTVVIHEQLNHAADQLENLMAELEPGAALHAQVVGLWSVTQVLQRLGSGHDVVESCRADVISQMDRAFELWEECHGQPSDAELAGIGCAIELAGMKFKLYQQMAASEANIAVMGGPTERSGA